MVTISQMSDEVLDVKNIQHFLVNNTLILSQMRDDVLGVKNIQRSLNNYAVTIMRTVPGVGKTTASLKFVVARHMEDGSAVTIIAVENKNKIKETIDDLIEFGIPEDQTTVITGISAEDCPHSETLFKMNQNGFPQLRQKMCNDL